MKLKSGAVQIKCFVCGKTYKASRLFSKYISFCDEHCFLSHIKSKPSYPAIEAERIKRLQTGFKSSYEYIVADKLCQYGIYWLYEAYMLKDDAKKILYIPDFFLPDFNIFIEAKGVPVSVGMKKFHTFASLYPENFIILDGTALRRFGWLKK